MKKICLLAISIALCISSCTKEEPKQEHTSSNSTEKLASPTNITVTQQGGGVLVKWEDNSEGESGFSVFYRRPDKTIPTRLGKADADMTELLVKSQYLFAGESYLFGVCANSPIKESLNSEIVYSNPVEILDFDPSKVNITVDNSLITYASIAVRHNVEDFVAKIVERGICWGEEENPTIDGDHLAASMYVKDEQLQLIPSAVLDADKPCHIRAYASTADKTIYSKDVVASLAPQPEAITFDWKEITPSTFPSEVKVYSVETTLDNSPFMAWYAIADISTGNVGLRANSPSGVQTLDAQWKSDCYVMINGGYFYNGNAVGLSVINGEIKTTLSTVSGSLRGASYDGPIAPESSVAYPVTRGAFGVDESGVAKAFYAYNRTFFDAPLPHVIGDQKYDIPDKSWTSHILSWSPKYAVGAGPMLLKDGKVLPELTESARGAEYFINNNEVIPYDIYNIGTTPDRTAIGVTADGKVVLFVVDGRIRKSDGAEIHELARIMKGIGCVDAVNMDGGGSTNMWVNGARVNSAVSNYAGSTENRAVATTWCFYRK